MTDEDLPVKSHKSACKYRCASEAIFFGEAKLNKRRFVETSSDLGASQLDALLGKPIISRELIQHNIEWVFKRRNRYEPYRFNTQAFAAYYTSKLPETAVKERKHHLPHSRDRLVVFSVIYSGETADLRPAVTDGVFEMDNEYSSCQREAERARKNGLKGIAAPSLRDEPEGSCCAIFERGCLLPGEVLPDRF